MLKNPLSLKLALIFPFLTPVTTWAHPDLGKGILHYDLEAGLKDRCISLDPTGITSSDVGQTEYTLHLIQNKEELHDKIETSASAKGSFGSFSASAKMKFVKEVHWNYNSVYILTKATRISKRISIPAENTLIGKAAHHLLLDSQFRFNEACGSAFIRSIDLGAEIYGLMEIVSSSQAEKQQIESSIRAGGGFTGGSASGKANYKRIIEKLSSEFRLSLKIQKTSQALELPDTVEGLLGLSQQIEHIGDQDPRPVAYATRDYTTLSNYVMDPRSSEYQIRQIQIDEAQRVLKEARALQANILYTLEHPRDFKRFDPTSLEKKLTYLDDKIIGLKIEIAKSMSFQHTPDPESLRVDLSAELPAMKRSAGREPLQVSCEIKPHSTCGVATYQSKESSACGAIAPKEGTGPVCGVTFKFAPHPACGIKSFNIGTGPTCGVKRWNSCYACGKQKYPGGPRDKRACPKCGPAEFNSCQDKSFGPLEFNSCRTPENGVESYGTCRDKSFGYDFASCRHFTHGVESYRSCEVSVIGGRESACPKF